MLCAEALQRLDTAKEGNAPSSVVSVQGHRDLETIDPEAPLVGDEGGTIAGGMDPWHDADSESCASGFTGSSSRSEWEIAHDDFGPGDWDFDPEEAGPDQGLDPE